MEHSQEGMVTLVGADQLTEEPATAATGTADVEKVDIVDNKEAGAYELNVGGRAVAGLLYEGTGSPVTLLATSVFPEFRGQGIAGKLLGGVLVMLRAQGRTVTLTCPFAKAFVHAHPEYADVVDPDFPVKAHGHGH